ncbi:Flagellar basal-body rod protein FlgF [Caenispirillum salinarum AK4]|uniref:Flagellar basal-body rod protein FlgF n=1 Tax=Caenispirillum salinarum AK4 TaxID=1238182 RepID=K9GKJ3_9PROT|nr:DUF1217 domain-containing protein [Caenispirillum salinarum]EKV26545.1 Flagellar basal-body rod protein FlgF [Caenispirillum salinarum AK4]
MIISNLVAGLGTSSLTAHTVLNRDIDRYRQIMREDPAIKRETDYIRENIGTKASIDEVTDDYRLWQSITTAFGLEDQAYAKAMLKKVIREGATDREAMANQMVDPRYKELASFFEYDKLGMLNAQSPKWVDKLVEKYETAQFEKAVGESNENLRLAMYFERKVKSVKSWYQILGDKAMYQVALKMGGLPKEYAQVDIDKQAEYFKDKLPLEDLKDPKKLEKLLQSFLARADAEDNSAMANPTVQIMQSATNTGFSPIVSIDPTLFLKL